MAEPKIIPGSRIRLRGVSLKGKNRVREQGDVFVVQEVDLSVLSRNLGLLVCPEADRDNDFDPRNRWVLPLRDPDFEIVEVLPACETCGGTGMRVLNPDWPSGTECHVEPCTDCP